METKEKLKDILDEFVYDEWYGNDDIAEKLIASGVTVPQWIPVTERLPEEDGAYLVTTNCFGKHQVIDVRSFAKDGETVNKYDLAGEKYVWYFYDSEYGYVSTNCVTHWMQLPDPPKGE